MSLSPLMGNRALRVGPSVAVVLFLSLGPAPTFAASIVQSGDQAHPHGGILSPYPGPPPAVALDDRDRVSLNQGRPVYRQVEAAGGQRGVAVFRVSAPPEVVWSIILDFPAYPNWIENVAETDVYEIDGEEIFVRFRLRHWLGDLQYFVHHNYPGTRLGWGTWKLDYRRRSDLNDTVGFWRVDPVPGMPRRSDVTYGVEIRLKRWLPKFIHDAVSRQGLEAATTWVKTQAEIRASNAAAGPGDSTQGPLVEFYQRGPAIAP